MNQRSAHNTLQPIPVKRAPAGNSSRVPRNFRLLAKQSFEKQSSRNIDMIDTTDSFFDTNKIYLKSVQQEATMRVRKPSQSDDPFFEDSANK